MSKVRWTVLALILACLTAGAAQARPVEGPQVAEAPVRESPLAMAWEWFLSLFALAGEAPQTEETRPKTGCTADPDGVRRCS